jgi:chorismate dehydratase
MAGPLPLVDYFRLQETFERIGSLGIAVRGRAHSVLLFARKPIRQLDGATIAVTEETSTTAVLLRLLLEQRYRVTPASYDRVRVPSASGVDEGSADARRREAERGQRADADALLLIGDEALRFTQANDRYPFEIDLAFEWWLWQHLPCVFAVWAIRKDAGPQDKKQVELGLIKSLAMNQRQAESIAAEYSSRLGIPAADLRTYLSGFIYRLGQPEEAAIKRFKTLVDEYHLL